MKIDIASLRNEYLMASLDEKDVSSNPFDQFQKWFNEAIDSEILMPNAMALSTVSTQEDPSQRVVLLKGFDENGFVFYTNYASTKGKHIAANPKVSLLFSWLSLQRQVIIQGKASKVSRDKSEEYFHSRPRGSRLGAFVSNQSEKLSSRKEMEERLKEAQKQFKNEEIPLPNDWGGYTVNPCFFEFWQGKENRLHDRIYYEKVEKNWKIGRLSP